MSKTFKKCRGRQEWEKKRNEKQETIHNKLEILNSNINDYIIGKWGLPSDAAIKNLPAMQEMQVQSLDWENPLEEEIVFLLETSHGQRSLVGYSP